MKNHVLAFSFTALLCTWSAAPARAEDETPKPQKPKPGLFGNEGGGMRDKMRERFMEGLSPEIRQRFEAAREKAMEDPALQELRKTADKANRDFFKAVRDKMLELDPGLAEIVKNNPGGPGKGPKKGDVASNDMKDGSKPSGDEPKGEGKGKGWHGRRDGGGPTGLANLTEEERENYLAARETAKNDPAVQAAEKKKQEASTPEARQAASEEYRKAMTSAVLKANPSLAPVVEKMNPPAPAKESTQNTPSGTSAPQMQME